MKYDNARQQLKEVLASEAMSRFQLIKRGFGFHSFRVGSLTSMAKQGVPLHLMQQQARHANIETTAAYVNSLPAEKLKASEALLRDGVEPKSRPHFLQEEDMDLDDDEVKSNPAGEDLDKEIERWKNGDSDEQEDDGPAKIHVSTVKDNLVDDRNYDHLSQPLQERISSILAETEVEDSVVSNSPDPNFDVSQREDCE